MSHAVTEEEGREGGGKPKRTLEPPNSSIKNVEVLKAKRRLIENCREAGQMEEKNFMSEKQKGTHS